MPKAENKSALRTASVLAFERKLDPSDAQFCSGNWDGKEENSKWAAIEVREKSIRGTISNRLKAKDSDPAKLDAQIQSPNLQTVDVAALPSTADTLRVRFTLRVLGGAGEPSACNDPAYRTKLNETVQSYKDNVGFSELSARYAANIASGRFLWRNRLIAEDIQVRVRQLVRGEEARQWTFDAKDFNLRDTSRNEAAKPLGEVIAAGLSGTSYVLLEVTAYARVGAGQEVFPSQELILDRGDSRGQKSKTLYSVDGVAAMHSQKVGNALRTIDTWYPDGADLGPIAVEPYGSVTSQGKAYRVPKEKMDFYSLLDGWVLRDSVPDVGQQHFVIANLVRGGVFGKADKSD
jgi:CRISPR-associated protein Csy3